MNHASAAGQYATENNRYIGAQATTEAQRAISASMTELASMCGDLESEVRRLAARISLALPGGSPFDMLDKQQTASATNPNVPAPCRSHLTDELQSRIYQLRELAKTVSGMVERIEL